MVIVVLARQDSTRLPLKHLYPLWRNMGLLDLIFHRLDSRVAARKVLAVGRTDRLYAEWARAAGWEVFQNAYLPDERVLERVWQAVRPTERVVIVHGDSPFVCPVLINELLAQPRNVIVTEPSGMRVKVVHAGTLARWVHAVNTQQEHVFSLVGQSVLDEFRLWSVDARPARLVVDTWEDVVRMREVTERVGIDACHTGAIDAAIECDRAHLRAGQSG